MKYKPLIAGLALTVVGLAGCSSSNPEPAPSESGSNPSASAPAEASSQAPAVSDKPLEEMIITGDVAGLSFQLAPEDVQNQAGGLGDVAKNIKVKPAECQKLLTQAVANAADAEAVVSVVQQGTAGYGASVSSNGPDLKEGRKAAEKCSSFTMDIVPGAPAAKATSKISDLDVAGADDAYLAVVSVEIGGQKQSTISAVGKVGETSVGISGAGTAEKAKVEEIFKAQVEKINS